MEVPVDPEVTIKFTDGSTRDVLLAILHRDSDIVFTTEVTAMNEDNVGEDLTQEDLDSKFNEFNTALDASESFPHRGHIFETNDELHLEHTIKTIDAPQFSSKGPLTIAHISSNVPDEDYLDSVHPEKIGEDISSTLTAIANPSNNHLQF